MYHDWKRYIVHLCAFELKYVLHSVLYIWYIDRKNSIKWRHFIYNIIIFVVIRGIVWKKKWFSPPGNLVKLPHIDEFLCLGCIFLFVFFFVYTSWIRTIRWTCKYIICAARNWITNERCPRNVHLHCATTSWKSPEGPILFFSIYDTL